MSESVIGLDVIYLILVIEHVNKTKSTFFLPGLSSLLQNAEDDYGTLLHLEKVILMKNAGEPEKRTFNNRYWLFTVFSSIKGRWSLI
jgi:hypothetical protein